MFDIGFWEILMIAVVALVVVGPERMPRLIKVTGLWIGKASASIQSVRNDISRELRAEELRNSISEQIPDAKEAVERYVFSDDVAKKPEHVEAEPVDDAVVAINDDPAESLDLAAKDKPTDKDNYGN